MRSLRVERWHASAAPSEDGLKLSDGRAILGGSRCAELAQAMRRISRDTCRPDGLAGQVPERFLGQRLAAITADECKLTNWTALVLLPGRVGSAASPRRSPRCRVAHPATRAPGAERPALLVTLHFLGRPNRKAPVFLTLGFFTPSVGSDDMSCASTAHLKTPRISSMKWRAWAGVPARRLRPETSLLARFAYKGFVRFRGGKADMAIALRNVC